MRIWLYCRASYDPEDKEASVQTQAVLHLQYLRYKLMPNLPAEIPWINDGRMFDTDKGCGIFGMHADGSIFKVSGTLSVIYEELNRRQFPVVFAVESNVRSTTPLAQRPVGGIMNALLEPGDHVVVTRSDRAFRQFHEFIAVSHAWTRPERNITLHCHREQIVASADATAATWFFMNIMALAAEFENRLRRERTKEGMSEKKRSGFRYAGGAGLGWTLEWCDKANAWRRVPNPSEMALMEQMYEWLKKGNTQKDIWRHLSNNGVKRKKLVAKPNARRKNGKVCDPKDFHFVEQEWSISNIKQAIKMIRGMRKAHEEQPPEEAA